MDQDLRILIVEDNLDFRKQTVRAMLPFNEVFEADSIASARKLISTRCFDVAILDKRLPDGEVHQLIPEINEKHPDCGILILTGDGDSDQGQIHKYLALGAHDYVQKTEYAISDLKIRIPAVLGKIALLRKSKALEDLVDQSFRYEIVGHSESTRKLRERILTLKGNRSPILITGESGSGKELVARMLNKIETPSRVLVTVNCGAISPNLVESELFGHKRGSFTGAVREQVGKFELAHQGDLFLDEIGDLQLDAQVKLLRVLQEGEFTRVGDAITRRTSARIIAATNKDLLKEVQDGKFRKDLYYRLKVIPIETKPLRERREDIPDVAQFLLNVFEKGAFSFGTGVVAFLSDQPWPGNARELSNAIERATFEARVRGSGVIELEDLAFLLEGGERAPDESSSNGALLPTSVEEISSEHLERYLRDHERRYFEKAMSFFDSNIEVMAQHMGCSRSGLFRRLGNLQLTRRAGVKS